ncbi:MAG: WYL domain-containing protein [Daejeonella sp.]
MSQSKMSRLLRLMMLLNNSRTYSMKELEERTGMSGSTLYRYLDTFEEAGFLINRRSGRYNLKAEDKNVRSLNKLFHFSEEEAYILYQTLSLLEKSSPIKEKLIRKLHTLYDFRSMAAARQNSRMELISTISAAMEEKKQMELVAYRSSNSDTITNRTVEPFQFLDDYAALWCFDISDKQCKQFRLARMESVGLSAAGWKYESEHQIPFCDAFRLSGSKPLLTVIATLSLKAYNLLTEEYPLSQPCISACGQQYRLEIPVADYHGIGRFVLGLPEDVMVEGPPDFLRFLEEKRKNNQVTVIS